MIEHTVFLYLSVRVQRASLGFIFNMALYPRLYALLNTTLFNDSIQATTEDISVSVVMHH